MATIENLEQAVRAGWQCRVRCTFGHGAIAKMDRCDFSYQLNMQTLLCTRGAAFPLSQLASRLMCPKCSERRVLLAFEFQANLSKAISPSGHTGGRDRVAQRAISIRSPAARPRSVAWLQETKSDHQMTARRHHYISQCYLKAFAVDRRKGSSQLHVFARESRKTFVTATENVGLERDFNRVDVDGEAPDAFEKMLSGFESDLASALERTIEAETFQTRADYEVILNFIALLAIRNPRHRESVRDIHEQILKKMLGLSLATKERWEKHERDMEAAGYKPREPIQTYEEVKAFYKSDNYKINLDTGYHIGLELKSFEAILPHLIGRGWMMMKAPKDSGGFITSDHPVSLTWRAQKDRGFFNSPGFGHAETQVIFPLSPKLALAGAFEMKDETREIPREYVAMTNGHTAIASTRQAFARDMHFRYQLRRDLGARKAARLIDEPLFGTQKKVSKTDAGA